MKPTDYPYKFLIRVDEDTKRILFALAAVWQCSKAEVVRRLLKDFKVNSAKGAQ